MDRFAPTPLAPPLCRSRAPFSVFSVLLLMLFLFACTKTDMQSSNNALIESRLTADAMNISLMSGSGFDPHYEDSIERKTILGIQLTNPYLVVTMQQAYANLGLDPAKAVVNNLYVRFRPVDIDQLVFLDSLMDTKGLELFDTPMDYEILQEGDYYQDPLISDENITWLYAVVPPAFSFPSGIQYEVLAQIHIPDDDYTAVETEAERLAAIQDCLNRSNPNMVPARFPDTLQCAPGYVWDPDLRRCIPEYSPCAAALSSGTVSPQGDPHELECAPGYEWDPILGHCVPVIPPPCSTGYYWNGSACVPYSQQPPAPAPDAAKPSGHILVHDTNFDGLQPVRKVRIVAKRWFKIERTYTDNNGYFQIDKRFKNKVKVNVKFKNDYAEIRKLRGVRLWQMLFPVKATIGVFSGNKSNIEHGFVTFTERSAKGNSYWVAATVHNAVQEYREFAVEESIGLPPSGLKIILTNWGEGASAPLFSKRALNDMPVEYLAYSLSPPVALLTAVAITLKQQIDITITYSFKRLSTMASDRVKETVYHELTHAAHYQKLGNYWYTHFVNMEILAIVHNLDAAFRPYGDGTNPIFSPIIALAEGWAYYMGHFMADRRYGITASCQREQGGGMLWCNSMGTGRPHLDVLEHFDPNLTTDPFRWIPQGLFYDLWDPANEVRPPVNDFVAGYTNSELYNAFQSDIFNLQQYRLRLLATTTNPTFNQVAGLFTEYNH